MSFISLRNMYSQLFPPKPLFTTKELPTQQGRIFVTSGNSGIGFELCKILYGTGATIYMTSMSKVSETYPGGYVKDLIPNFKSGPSNSSDPDHSASLPGPSNAGSAQVP